MKRIMGSSQRGSKTSNCVLAAVFALIAAFAAKAETVVWYDFDGLGEAGTSVSHGTTIQNKANPGTHDATVLGLMNYTLKPDSTKMPICTNGIPESFRVFDPVSSAMSQGVDRALRFQSTWNTGDGAFLQVANDADLRPEAFTVEAMVWFPKDATSVNNWNVIAVHPAKMTCANADAWGFRFTGPTQIIVRFTRPHDGRWHHVAFTAAPNGADSSKTDVKVFFDYNQVDSSTLDFRPQFSGEDDCPVWIGSTRQSFGFFTGAIGEFRFSNVALTPDKFLRHHNAGMDKDCVLYYDFEATAEELDWLGATLGEVVNKAMPGFMDGSIVTNNNLAPAFVEGSPAGRIRQSTTSATYETSEKSLRNYITDADHRDNGYVTCTPLDDEWFSKTNFTVECFVNTDNLTQNYTALFQRWGGYNVQIKLGINGSGGSFGVNFSTNTLLQREFTIAPMTSGKWHHVALVVDQTGETKTLRGYLDHQQRLETSLESNLAAEDRQTHNGAWYFAGSKGARSFDGAIDSMRVTLRALTPDEFLSIKKFPVDRTLAYVKFDDGTVNADPDGATMTNGVNTAARSGGAAATFSDDVPGAIIRDGENGEILTKHNKSSLSLSGSKVTWGSSSDNYQDTYYIRNTLSGEKRTAWTVELWMKPDSDTPNWGRLLTATANNEMNNYYPFALTINESKKLSLRSMPTPGGAEEGSGNPNRIDWDLNSVNIFDGKWHHVAFSFAPSEADSTKSEVKFYVDYGSTYSATRTATILIEYPERLIMHMGDGSSADYKGLIDELRISDGALEPSQFLRAENAPGLSIFIR